MAQQTMTLRLSLHRLQKASCCSNAADRDESNGARIERLPSHHIRPIVRNPQVVPERVINDSPLQEALITPTAPHVAGVTH
jgi:hypothetical protein